MRLARKFFARGAEDVAGDLLGKVLVRSLGFARDDKPQVICGVIIETEAYVGEQDLASHARFGRTKRTEVMYGEPGTVYMFFTYGVHWMFNIVCGKVGNPQAVLIRGVKLKNTELSGPGKLTKFLQLDGSFYGEDLITSERIWVEGGRESVGSNGSWGKIITTPRVGVGYAKEWAEKPLRFLLKMDTFEKVRALVRKIPKGSVTTYGWVGRQLGVSPRVVGFALHGNKDTEIPCHRVVNREGRVAVNYAFGGGEKQKEKLLFEGVEFVDDTYVNLEKCLWNTVKLEKTHA